MRIFRTMALGALLLVGAAGCDLAVENMNAPDAERALSNPGDVEALIAGSWINWWYPTYHYIGGGPWLSTASFQHSAYPANFAMVEYSAIPRVPTGNDPSHGYYGQISMAYTYWYRAISAVNDGLKAVLVDESADLGDDEARAIAWGRFVQGLSYGYLGLLYGNGPLVDETTDLTGELTFVEYPELIQASLDYLQEAIDLAQQNEFDIPVTWHWGGEWDQDRFAQVAHSFRARIRANSARTLADREAVDWNAVLADIDAGIEDDLLYTMTRQGFQGNWSLYYMLLRGWGQMNYFVAGMADTSGKYAEWMNEPVSDRHPNLDSGPFLIQTPDLRFPQGETEDEQKDNPGTRFQVANAAGDQWQRPDRGSWRWSYYHERKTNLDAVEGLMPDISMHEMNLLAAEAHYHLGNLDQAAELINLSRVEAGLNATDASGTNTSCVPTMPPSHPSNPNGCGDLWEMLKWEKRMMTGMEHGLLTAPWFFDSRGWGDLHEGTIMQLPVPALVAELAGQPQEQYGGANSGNEWSAPVGTYGY
ncbi:MAG: hypothetical protein ACOC3J_01655 [Gemmatimonadota bacterium]